MKIFLLLPLLFLASLPTVCSAEKVDRVGNTDVKFYTVKPADLAEIKTRLLAGDPSLNRALKNLIKDADRALKVSPPAVTDKAKAPVSGDKHDYMTSAPYYWPDPNTADGLPFIRHDGKVNPESRSDVYDHNRNGLMAATVETLCLAYYYTGKEVYAAQAAKFLRTWFLNPATRMNPNLNFAQAVPGKSTGRGTGIIEGRNLSNAADFSGLLAGSESWTSSDDVALKAWLAKFLDWMLTSENGREEAAASNNHGTFYDTQVMRLALLLGRKDLAMQYAEAAKTKRINVQIEADGRQPLELERQTSLGYSFFNLEALFELATLGEFVGVDLWNYQSPDGRGIQKAVDFLIPYVAKSPKKWPYKQIKPLEFDGFSPVLFKAASVYQDSKYQRVLSEAGSLAGERLLLLCPSSGSTISVAAIDRVRVLKVANAALKLNPLSITKFRSKLSEGGPNDFYSNGDYWWPNPKTSSGLPYVKRDGETNPENFNHHRAAVLQLGDSVAALGAAYKITQHGKYAKKAAELLQVFFLDSATRMNPHLKYAQAVPGVSSGRGIGIIDTLHLIEIPVAIDAMSESNAFPPNVAEGMKKWFTEYLDWMLTSENGKEEAAAKNNHSVAFWTQAAVFARFTGNEKCLDECRRQFTEVFVPEQMAADGSFPLELARTKPYGYSIFQLDNMAILCQVLSTSNEDLWSFSLPDGRGIRKAIGYLYPYLADKAKWPLKPDVQAWDGWPARQPSLLFGGLAFSDKPYLELWKKLPPDPTDPEVQRNIAITQPLLWLK